MYLLEKSLEGYVTVKKLTRAGTAAMFNKRTNGVCIRAASQAQTDSNPGAG